MLHYTYMAAQKKRTKQPKRGIPFRSELFWDVDPKKIDPKKHATYIIERILDFGNDKEARWVYHRYPRRLINKIARRSRVLSAITRPLWIALTNKR